MQKQRPDFATGDLCARSITAESMLFLLKISHGKTHCKCSLSPDEEGARLCRKFISRKWPVQVGMFEQGMAQTSQSCQRYLLFTLLALLPTPHCGKTEGSSSRHQKGSKETAREATKLRQEDCHLQDRGRSPSLHTFATEAEGAPRALHLFCHSLTQKALELF